MAQTELDWKCSIRMKILLVMLYGNFTFNICLDFFQIRESDEY